MEKERDMEKESHKFLSILFIFLFYTPNLQAALESKKKLLFYFDRIEVKGNVDIFLTEGRRPYECTIYADSEIIGSVQTRVSQKTLLIDANNTFNLARRLPFIRLNAERKFPVEIIISIGKLQEIRLLGKSNLSAQMIEAEKLSLFMASSGKLHIEKLISNKVFLNHQGQGNIILKGDVNELDATISENGSLIAEDLKLERAFLTHKGSGLVHLRPDDWLDARMLSQGDLFLHKTPRSMVVDKKGTGKVSDILPGSKPILDFNKSKN